MNNTSTVQFNNSTFGNQEVFIGTSGETFTEIAQFPNGQYRVKPALFLHWEAEQRIVSMPPRSFYTVIGKRIVDFILATLVIVFVLSWLVLIVGILILLESRGPIFFVQDRSGYKGKPFRCFKFRTMQYSRALGGEFRQTTRNDDRVTRLGRFLRKTNLDEMPQFLNVLLGNMSLVGPRPHAVPHDAQHWVSMAYRERYWVQPGITGLAQIRGSRGATGMTQRMEHRVRYDHLYIRRQSFVLDMKICYRTVRLMIKGDSNAC